LQNDITGPKEKLKQKGYIIETPELVSMRLSVSNGAFSRSTLQENIATVSRLGFDNLEFNMKCVEENDEESVNLAKRLIDSYGLDCLTVHAATLPVRNESEIPKAVYYGRVSTDFAYKLSAGIMVVHSNVSRGLPKNLRTKFMKKIFKKLNPYAEKMGVRLSLENLSYASHSYGKDVAELEEVFGIMDCDGKMGVTLDFCHGETTGQTFELLEKFKNRISNVHLSNRAHMPFETETRNLRLFLKSLREYGYGGPLTLELNEACTSEEILGTKRVLEDIIVAIS
jgi:sugar phosphate isomerase/epimerase